MSERRFLVAPENLDETASRATIQGEEHHHLRNVLRLSAGDEVSLFDGRGRGCRGEIASVGRDATLVKVTGPDERASEPSHRVVLAQGIPHHDKMDLVVQKTTELGVWAIVPVIAHRTTVRGGPTGAWKRLDRWRRVAAEAARQSGRLVVPEVADPLAWDAFLESYPPGAGMRGAVLAPHHAGSEGPGALRAAGPHETLVAAVGPEGGWSDEELARAESIGYRPVGLGSRVLRTETAAIVAVALALLQAGEMGPLPGEGGAQAPASA